MNQMFFLFLGARNDFDRWLDQNPLVLGGIALLVGMGFLAWGVNTLMNGVATDKRGRKHTGGIATLHGWVRVVFGVFAAGFGIYKLIQGLF